MYEVVAEQFKLPCRLKKARLSFSKLMLIGEGLLHEDYDKWLWEAVSCLNRIRNDLAHNLEPSELDLKLDRFLENFERDDSVNGFYRHARSNDKHELLRRALADMLFYLSAMRKEEV